MFNAINARPWDGAEHLETEEDMAAYLEAALEQGDASLIAAALGDIARARGRHRLHVMPAWEERVCIKPYLPVATRNFRPS